ncbi:MAG TPA: pilus assembly protein PilM [Planctomycetota bacterium]|nr:pilus assembly protein PilM [Planctomycetota bacterium]
MSTTAGIDIGAEAIKGVVLKAGKSGPVEVIGAGTMPIGDLTRMPESEDRSLAIGEKLKELVRSARLRADTRRLGAGGGNTAIKYLQIPPVPPWRLEMLVKYQVQGPEDKVTQAHDYHIMDVPETSGQYTVIVGQCEDKFAFELLGQAKSSGLGEIELDLEALALFSAYYHGHGFDPDKTVAVVDIGADDLTLLVCRNGALYYARTVMGGGRRFTQNLADDLKIEWNEAEELKKTAAEICFDVAPGASSVQRAARIPRAGGTTIIPRAASSAVQPGLPARPAVTQAPGAGSSSTNPASEEARRARVADAAKLTRPVNGASQSKAPGVSGSAASASAQETPPAESGTGETASKPRIKLEGNSGMDFSIPSFDDIDLSDAPAASASSSSAPAPVKPLVQSAAPVPVKPATPPKPAASAPKKAERIDEFELQPLEEEDAAKKSAPIPAAKPAPVPPPTSAGASDVVDLVPLQDPAKTMLIGPPGASTVMLAADPLLESSSIPVGGGPGATAILPRAELDEKDKRKRQMSGAMVREAASLCAAIENVVMNAKQQCKQPNFKLDRLYITGGGSKLKGLSEFMSRRLRVEVQPLEPLRNLSLNRLTPAQAEDLRAEQHTFCIALGLALSDLRKGAFNFMLLPQSVKTRKEFWARGAYLYYAAGAALLALGVLMYTPYRNTDKLNANAATADTAAKSAKSKNSEVVKLAEENDEYRNRLKTITENVQSGSYFLTLLGELKNRDADGHTGRIQDDIYLTCLSTSIPNCVKPEDGPSPIGKPTNTANSREELTKALAANKEPDTFQAQRRVYLRGFLRGKENGNLIPLVKTFFDRLVPDRDNPDNPLNLFKDIRPIWYATDTVQKEGYYLQEFVLEAYTDAPPKEVKPVTTPAHGPNKNPKAADKAAAPEKAAPPTAHVDPLQPKPAENPTQPLQPVQIQPIQPQPIQPVQVQPVQPVQPIKPVQPVQVPPVQVPPVQVRPVQPVQVPPVQVQPVPPVPVQPPVQQLPPAQQPKLPVQPVQPVPVQPVPPQPKQKPVYVLPDDPVDNKPAPKP